MQPKKKLPENLHKNHRSRMWSRFLETGSAGFSDHQLLELLLFFSIPRRDTNPLAHALLYQFGSLPEVLHARKDDLMELQGVGAATADLIALLPELESYYWREPRENRVQLRDSAQTLAFLSEQLSGVSGNRFYILLLDAHYSLQRFLLLSETDFAWDSRFFQTVADAVQHNSTTYAILAGCHENDCPVPGLDENMSIKRLDHLLSDIGIRLLDYVGFATNQHYFMRKAGML